MDVGRAAFEAARVAELAVSGVPADVARALANDEWMQMDDAAKECCSRQASVAADPAQSSRPVSPVHSLSEEALNSSADVGLDPPPGLTTIHSSGHPANSMPAASGALDCSGEPERRPRKRKAKDVAVSTEGKKPNGDSVSSDDWIQINSYRRGIDDSSHMDDDVEERSELKESDDVDVQCAIRASQTLAAGGLHPDWLTEPAAVSQISLPCLPGDMVLRIPCSVAKKSLLSSPQFESVAYAVHRFSAFLPNGARCGYYLGDGTGCGKGRVIAALVWHLWNSGSRRHVWLSATADLVEDARRDVHDIGANLPISSLSRWSYGKIGSGKGLDENGNGIMFASYSIFVSSSASREGPASPENSRLMQLVDWLNGKNGGTGLIALDEAHRTKNVGDALVRSSKGSKTGLSALELVRACPKCAVLYASATGATEIRHLGYLERLGLWGPGRPHKNFEELQKAVDSGGLAAMELIAMTMRAEGMLSCRALSFKGTSFRLQQVQLAGALREIYAAACGCWQDALRLLIAITKTRRANIRAKRLRITIHDNDMTLVHRHFWGYQQKFFRQLLICTKVDETVSLAQAALIRDESVVISMWSTGEAITHSLLERGGVEAADGFASAPEEIARRLLDKIFKPLCEGAESQLVSQFERLKASFSKLKLPPNPLDDLIERLGGPREVAELTGRTRRLVRHGPKKEVHFEDRGDGANLEEQRAFQNGRKRVAVITEAASAGISLHCDLRLPKEAQRPRYMISIELPWEADKAVQQLGRVHRSNQKVPPKYAIVVTELGGEVRFVSAVARRLRILGAMMRGDRNSAHGAVQSLVAFDIQNWYGRRALSRFYELLRTDWYSNPEVSFSFLKSQSKHSGRRHWKTWKSFAEDATKALESVGLKPDSDDKHDESTNSSTNLNVFMNRILMLEPGVQNALFDAVAELYSYLIGQDRADGSFDGGLVSLHRQGRKKASVSVAHREVLYKDPETSAETTYVRLRIDRTISWAAAVDIFESDCDTLAEGFYWEQCRSGQREIVLVVAKPRIQARPGMEDDDDDDPFYDLHRPQGIATRHGGSLVTRAMLRSAPFQKTRDSERAEVERVWKTLLAVVGEDGWSETHVLSGSILNTWAVVGSAMGEVSSPARAHVPRKIPLVRAQLSGGGAVVGVRVRPECLQGVRYALRALLQQASECRARGSEPDTAVIVDGQADDAVVEQVPLPSVEEIGEHLEKCFEKNPQRRLDGWGCAHAALVEAGIVDGGARGMLAVQEAVTHLETNGKVDIDEATGSITLLEKQKGCGWYIPPPKKPKATRGRGRGRGRGR